MTKSNLRTAISFLTSCLVISLCGCASLVKPSDDTRHTSYDKIQNLMAADREAVRRQTYVVFSGDSHFTMTMTDPKTGHIKWSSTGGKYTFTRGLAIGIDNDGYLLTAGHVARSNTFVMGWFNGRIDLQPARLVFRNDFKFPADVALLKVEGKMDHCAIFGNKPKVGDRVFAVADYYKSKEAVGMIDFVGGTVTGVKNGPSGSSVTLIRSDVPLWHGDSGGPLLSSTGKLVGVFSEFDWLGVYRTTSFLPDIEFIRSLIAVDRASNRE